MRKKKGLEVTLLKISQLEEQRRLLAKEYEDLYGMDIDSENGAEWEYVRDMEYIETMLRLYRYLNKVMVYNERKVQKGEYLSRRPFEWIACRSLNFQRELRKDIKKIKATIREMKTISTLCKRYML